jgi:tripartite-type tricarboxylate transporter receptor subunit TctC
MNSSAPLLFLLALLLSATAVAQTRATGPAQAYPEKPIRLVVGSAPGGGNDFVARVTNAKLSEFLGKQVVIDNRGGAGGLLGTEIVAHAPPDGYTLLQMFSNLAILPTLHPKMSFDVEKNLAPIVNLASTPLILVVHPSVPAKTVPDLIEYARGRNGAVNFAAPGIGSLGHLAGELFKSMAKVEMSHVAYKGGGPAIAALVGNEVHLYFSTVPAALTQVKAGRLRALGISSSKRSAAAPQVPTIQEQGLRGFEVVGWFGMFAPAGTPSYIINTINAGANKTIALAEVKERLASDGVEPEGGSPAAFAKQVKQDIEKWNAVARQAGIQPGKE